MESRINRRRFVTGAVASGVVLTVRAEAAAAGSSPSSALHTGRFVRADGPRSAVVELSDGGSVNVKVDTGAFVAHGADGVVDDLRFFVRSEPIVMRGARSPDGIAAMEFQSVYSSVQGTLASAGADYGLDTPRGRVRVPKAVVRRDAPAGVALGAACTATIWTNPVSGESVALDLNVGA